MVMFHGMDRHSGIRTVSQDAARTAGGHSAQDTARRDTERPAESMSLPPRWDYSDAEQSHTQPRPNSDAGFFSPADCSFSAATFQAAAVGRRRRRLIFFIHFHPDSPPLLPFATSLTYPSFLPPLSLSLPLFFSLSSPLIPREKRMIPFK